MPKAVHKQQSSFTFKTEEIAKAAEEAARSTDEASAKREGCCVTFTAPSTVFPDLQKKMNAMLQEESLEDAEAALEAIEDELAQIEEEDEEDEDEEDE